MHACRAQRCAEVERLGEEQRLTSGDDGVSGASGQHTVDDPFDGPLVALGRP
jgi:hypothetical protein